jgi:tRNA uridine 5-carbamoylmethylation protein Kti12
MIIILYNIGQFGGIDMIKKNEEVKFIYDKESGKSYIEKMIDDLEKDVKKKVSLEKIIRLNRLYDALYSIER